MPKEEKNLLAPQIAEKTAWKNHNPCRSQTDSTRPTTNTYNHKR